MKLVSLAIVSALSLTGPVAAQDGFYYGLGLGVTNSETATTAIAGFKPEATDYSLALTAGYRFASPGTLHFGIEGNLDVFDGKTMFDDTFQDIGRAACDNAAPTWCSIDTVLRLRGTVSTDLANGSRVMASIGAVAVQGWGEQGNSDYKDTHGTGMSWGLSWEAPPSLGAPVRVDVNWDSIKNDNLERFDQTLDMVGLRMSYMF